jgi:hypothetical protein
LKAAATQISQKTGPLLQRHAQCFVYKPGFVPCGGWAAAGENNTGESLRISELSQHLPRTRYVVHQVEHSSPAQRFVAVCRHTDAVSVDDTQTLERLTVTSTLSDGHEHAEAITVGLVLSQK